MARREHVVAPRDPTQTHAGAYMARSISRVKAYWAQGYTGPRSKDKGGVLGPIGDAKS